MKQEHQSPAHIKLQLGAPAFQNKLEGILRVALKAHSDFHEGHDKEYAKLTILWKTLTIMKKTKEEEELEAVLAVTYSQHNEGCIT
jgi:hypothetical protein